MNASQLGNLNAAYPPCGLVKPSTRVTGRFLRKGKKRKFHVELRILSMRPFHMKLSWIYMPASSEWMTNPLSNLG